LGGHDCVMLVAADARHSGQEARYAALGRTTAGRWLVVVFTILSVFRGKGPRVFKTFPPRDLLS